MRKDLLVMSLCSALALTACGGGGSDLPNIDEVETGTGPSFNLTTEASTTTSLAEATIFAVAVAVLKGVDDGSSAEQNQQTIIDICTKNQATLTYGPVTINGDGGSATVSGNGSASRSGDTGAFEQFIDAAMSAYGYASVPLAKKFTMTGDVAYTVDGAVTHGLEATCAQVSGAKHESDADSTIHQDLTETLTGALSIAGDLGAALTFRVTAATSSEAETITYDGTAALKSGTETTECSITGTVSTGDIDANVFEDLTIDC